MSFRYIWGCSLFGEAYRQDYTAGQICKYLPAVEYYLEIEPADDNKGGGFILTAESLVTSENKQGVDLFAGEMAAGNKTMRFIADVPTDVRYVMLYSKGEVKAWRLQSVGLMNYDNYLLALIFFLLAGGSWSYGGMFYKEEHNTILCLIGLGILASFPLFGNYLIQGTDLVFHLARINGIYEGLRTGQFPVRINLIQLGGYGYLSGSMCPQLFFYIPAFLKFFHISTMLEMKLLIFGANLSTAILSYYAVRGICRNHKIALMAAVLYTLNTYRLINFYSRGVLGEGLAMVFLPLILWGTYEILWNSQKKWWILALGMTDVFGSHILSLEFYTVLIF